MADALATLITGIVTKWDATATLTNGIPGGLHFAERPADDQANPVIGSDFQPYAILPSREQQSRLLAMSCGSELWEHEILFRVYGATPELCQTYAGLVRAIYDSDSLALILAEGSMVKHRPTGDVRYVQADKSVFYVDLPYEFVTQKDRTA
jgi:hypothetical protein